MIAREKVRSHRLPALRSPAFRPLQPSGSANCTSRQRDCKSRGAQSKGRIEPSRWQFQSALADRWSNGQVSHRSRNSGPSARRAIAWSGSRPRVSAAVAECSSRSRHTADRVLRRAESRWRGPAKWPGHRELPSVRPEFQLWGPESEAELTGSSRTVRGTERDCRGANSRSSLRWNVSRRPSHNRRNLLRHALVRTPGTPATRKLPRPRGAQISE